MQQKLRRHAHLPELWASAKSRLDTLRILPSSKNFKRSELKPAPEDLSPPLQRPAWCETRTVCRSSTNTVHPSQGGSLQLVAAFSGRQQVCKTCSS